MKKQIAGFITYKKHEWDVEGEYAWNFRRHKPLDTDAEILIMPHTVEVDIPDDFNPIPAQVKALEAKRLELQAKFAKELMEIEDSISKLTCLTMEAV